MLRRISRITRRRTCDRRIPGRDNLHKMQRQFAAALLFMIAVRNIGFRAAVLFFQVFQFWMSAEICKIVADECIDQKCGI